ncbi:MAG: SUMF1/EgtB/PvdO family nonheme iron enzyme, partial [Nannocystaceae bacterium]
MPLITEGTLGLGRTWSSARMVPGRHPLYALLSALEAGLDFDAEASFRSNISEEPTSLGRLLRKKLGKDRGKVIFIDQFEELVTISDPDEANLVGALITQIAVGIPGVKLLATVRGDFLTRVAKVPTLGAEIEEAVFLLRPMSPDSMRRAIVGPAGLRAVSFTPEDVIDDLVDEGIRGSLPLLQFALAELWEVRDLEQRMITRTALEQIGGVTGALARHADDMLARLLPTQRIAAKRLLMRLVTIEETRASLPEDELIAGDDAVRTALEALVTGRLVVARETDDGTIYEIAHEALIGGWNTLHQWLDQERENREIRRRLEIAARDWDRLARSSEVLWSAQQLGEAAGLDDASLAPRERAFVAASWSGHRRRLWRRRLALLSVPILAVLTYVGLQIQAGMELERKIDEHVANATATIGEAKTDFVKLESLRQQAFRAYENQEMSKGEAFWQQALDLEPSVNSKLKQSAQELETALRLNFEREDAVDLLADTLYERARFFDLKFESSPRDEMLERMQLYDRGGVRLAKWSAPALVQVKTSDPAVATLFRYESDANGYTIPGAPKALGTTPVAGLDVEPGSYLLTLEAEGHVPVRYPMYLHRGEEVELDLWIPEVGEIPAGFIYIPPGKSFYGSPGDEGMRKNFFNAVPAHQVEVDGYLIGQHEVTFGDWLTYLDAIPAEIRVGQLPNVTADPYRPGFKIEQLEDGSWQATVTIEQSQSIARAGERIVYPKREDDPQDWLKLPVVGISQVQGEAYFDWLDKSQKLVGARMCTEKEFERAARGADARLYTSGNLLLPGDANFDRTHHQNSGELGLDEVGSYPRSRSPFLVDDLAGNAWEITHSSQGAPKYVARGGGFSMPLLASLAINREPTQAQN